MQNIRPFLARNIRFSALLGFTFFVVTGAKLVAQTPPSATEVLDQTIAFHDPQDQWATLQVSFPLLETRPDGTFRQNTVTLNNAAGIFELETKTDGHTIKRYLDAEDCRMSLDGKTTFSEAQKKDFYLTLERTEWIRNYYVYLLGLPMKLKDPGTNLDPAVEISHFQDRPVYTLKVTYDPEVGGDVWHFYVDQESKALIGCKFFKNGDAVKGETLIFEGLYQLQGLKIPKVRKWYYNSDMKYLGDDRVGETEP